MQATDYLSDGEWSYIANYLEKLTFPKTRGKPRTGFREIFTSIIYVLKTGCRWCDIPEGDEWADDSTAHRWFQRFQKEKYLEKLFLSLLSLADAEGLIDWKTLLVDGTFSLRQRRRRIS